MDQFSFQGWPKIEKIIKLIGGGGGGWGGGGGGGGGIESATPGGR